MVELTCKFTIKVTFGFQFIAREFGPGFRDTSNIWLCRLLDHGQEPGEKFDHACSILKCYKACLVESGLCQCDRFFLHRQTANDY